MKKLKAVQFLLVLAALGLWVTGCATPNVNPPQARANTGYVDFHADPPEELWWEVMRFDDRAQNFQRVFSEFSPPPGGVLRLAFAPGTHRLRVTFLNRVIVKPVELDVEVVDAKVIPVQVTLTEAGVTLVKTETKSVGAARGGVGQRTKIGTDEAFMFSLSTVAASPMPYQVKAQTPYAH